MQLFMASTNPHKVREIRQILEAHRGAAAWAPELLPLNQEAAGEAPEEDGETFEANALIKARHYARILDRPCLADDSGIEVDALGGAPGVRSARYAGAGGSRGDVDAANNRKLLEALRGVPPERRGARFVCAMALVAGGEILATARGTLEGRILLPEEAADPGRPEAGRGRHGFGYDPLFLLPERGRTTAELAPAEKDALSHRGRAARGLSQAMAEKQ